MAATECNLSPKPGLRSTNHSTYLEYSKPGTSHQPLCRGNFRLCTSGRRSGMADWKFERILQTVCGSCNRGFCQVYGVHCGSHHLMDGRLSREARHQEKNRWVYQGFRKPRKCHSRRTFWSKKTTFNFNLRIATIVRLFRRTTRADQNNGKQFVWDEQCESTENGFFWSWRYWKDTDCGQFPSSVFNKISTCHLH